MNMLARMIVWPPSARVSVRAHARAHATHPNAEHGAQQAQTDPATHRELTHFVGGDGEPSCAYVHGNNGGYKGLQMVPDNYEDWYKLVRALAEHLIGRYGLSEIKAWHFEVWNEMQGLSPNNKGLPLSYMQLFNASARALKDVSPMLRVGGPATMQLLEVENFIRNCSAWSPPIPIDFITTHLCKYNS